MTEAMRRKIHDEFSKYPLHVYEKGQIIIYTDDEVDHIYYLTKGTVREYDITYRGDEIVLTLFREGSFFPMSNIVNKVKSRYYYRSESDVELHVIPAEEALKFVKANTDILYNLLRRVYKGTDALLDRYAQAMSGSAKARIVYELTSEVNRQPSQKGAVKLEISEQDLAARTGMTRETVSRQIKTLKDNSIVDVSRNGITIVDYKKLKQIYDNL